MSEWETSVLEALSIIKQAVMAGAWGLGFLAGMAAWRLVVLAKNQRRFWSVLVAAAAIAGGEASAQVPHQVFVFSSSQAPCGSAPAPGSPLISVEIFMQSPEGQYVARQFTVVQGNPPTMTETDTVSNGLDFHAAACSHVRYVTAGPPAAGTEGWHMLRFLRLYLCGELRDALYRMWSDPASCSAWTETTIGDYLPDATCLTCATDSDGDGVSDELDADPADPLVCGDRDGDGSDDCGPAGGGVSPEFQEALTEGLSVVKQSVMAGAWAVGILAGIFAWRLVVLAKNQRRFWAFLVAALAIAGGEASAQAIDPFTGAVTGFMKYPCGQSPPGTQEFVYIEVTLANATNNLKFSLECYYDAGVPVTRWEPVGLSGNMSVEDAICEFVAQMSQNPPASGTANADVYKVLAHYLNLTLAGEAEAIWGGPGCGFLMADSFVDGLSPAPATACDRGPDLDGDGVEDGVDPDPDNPKICGDWDGDGADDCADCNSDRDDDGVSDCYDPAPDDPMHCGDHIDEDGNDDCVLCPCGAKHPVTGKCCIAFHNMYWPICGDDCGCIDDMETEENECECHDDPETSEDECACVDDPETDIDECWCDDPSTPDENECFCVDDPATPENECERVVQCACSVDVEAIRGRLDAVFSSIGLPLDRVFPAVPDFGMTITVPIQAPGGSSPWTQAVVNFGHTFAGLGGMAGVTLNQFREAFRAILACVLAVWVTFRSLRALNWAG